MTALARSRIASASRAAAPILLLLICATLLRFPPDRYNFYPRCPIFTLFHLQCPGCGATRAFAALLQGHLREALHYNALFTLTLPFAILWSVRLYRGLLQRKPLRWPQPPQSTIYAALTIAVIFTIARNL